ncbi:MAG: HYR domain-containing protein, partial [Limisphaerales bacterium]
MTPPFPDCPLCCFNTTFTPPSGSLFPIGTTTVQCQGHDGCGETPTCSFDVTVLKGSLLSGIAAAPLGLAGLFFPSGGTSDPISMVISNIGTSGQDGFHADVGAADSLVLNFDPFPNYDITGMVSTVTGPYAGDPNHLLGTSMYQGGLDAMVMADYSALGATSIVAQVTDENHNLVSYREIPNGSWFNVNNLFPPGCTNPTSTVCTVKMGPGLTCWRFCRYGCTCQGTNCTIERVVCLFELVNRALTISGVNFTAQGSNAPSSLIIRSAQLGMFGNLQTAIGSATL